MIIIGIIMSTLGNLLPKFRDVPFQLFISHNLHPNAILYHREHIYISLITAEIIFHEEAWYNTNFDRLNRYDKLIYMTNHQSYHSNQLVDGLKALEQSL